MKNKLFKICALMLCFILAVSIVGCKKKPTEKPGNNQGGNGNNIGGNSGNQSDIEYDFMGAKFTIMVDVVSTSDPRNANYTKLFKEEKVKAIEAVEKKYNIKVEYVPYPSDASWGGARERYIIQNSAAGTPKAHIYEVPSYSIGTLAVANSITPLTSLIEAYGVKGYWKEAQAYGTALGEIYSYQDIYPTADEGIFYNIDLLEDYLGEGNGDLPSRLWLNGEWTWDKYKEICTQLDQALPNDYYVMGGTAYNWAYQMLGANGVHVIDGDLKCQLTSQAAIDTLAYLNTLNATIRWDIDSCDLANATSTEMVKGKVAFHNGQSYWIYQSNKWLDKNFEIGFVPYPVGPNIKDRTNLSDYYINDVYGKTQFVISSSYSKANIKPGYENSTLYDEIIFKIWSEMQVFPKIDPTTNYCSIDDYIDEYIDQRIISYYGSLSSIECHRSVITKGYPDYFYSLDEAKAQTEGSYMLTIQSAVKGEIDDIRARMTNLSALIEASFKVKYNLDEDYYD